MSVATPTIAPDQIIPARFLKVTTREGLGRHAFADWKDRPEATGAILVAGAGERRALLNGLPEAVQEVHVGAEHPFRDRLGGGAHDHPASLPGRLEHGARDARQDAPDRGARLVRELVQVRLALLGDHERVSRRERVDVEEREHVLVLVDAVAGNGPLEDLVEDRSLAHAGECSSSRVTAARAPA